MGFEIIENRTALDSSGHDNNAVLSAEVRLSVTESKCGSALSMGGGRLLFTHFNRRPREAITIALWLKLESVSGTATLFKTTGSGAKYHLKVADGIIYWSHVDDLGHVIFSMETRQTVDSLDWVHVSATYDAHINMSKIILNGAVLDEKEGYGLLSQNWDGEVGIGITEGIRGLIDEFYMYNHALAASDLSDLSEECNPGAGKIHSFVFCCFFPFVCWCCCCLLTLTSGCLNFQPQDKFQTQRRGHKKKSLLRPTFETKKDVCCCVFFYLNQLCLIRISWETFLTYIRCK